jgi:hypothetical protein
MVMLPCSLFRRDLDTEVQEVAHDGGEFLFLNIFLFNILIIIVSKFFFSDLTLLVAVGVTK